MNALEFFVVNSPIFAVAIPLLGAFLTPVLGMINDKLRNVFAILIMIITAGIVFLLSYDVVTNGIRTYIFGAQDLTLPVVRILFEVDAMSCFMAIISVILALVALIYSWAFMKENTGLDKYYTLLLLMTTGMLGMELTGDMFNFFVFLEITSISSAALVAFWINRGKSVEAGFKYIVISTIGALFVLFSVALFYGQYNALNMAIIANSIQFNFLDKIALVLLIGALAMKAGIVPLHMWLPDAYSKAPSSITLILIGATQASLYGLLRVCFTIYGNMITLSPVSIGWVLVLFGIVTILLGVIMAIAQVDLKRLIAFAAVGEIGYMILGIGTGLVTMSPDISTAGLTALKGGIFHIMNDALDVGLMFLVAGAIYYATRETSLNRLGGLARNMKYTTVFFIIGLLAVSGLPPMNGFASKLLIYESTYQLNPVLAIIAILSSILLLAIFVKVLHSAFLGPALPRFNQVKEVPKSMLFAMAIIAGIIIVFGVFPDIIVTNIVEPAANALVDNAGYISKILSLAGGA